MSNSRLCTSLALAFVLLTVGASAQAPNAPSPRLSKVTSLKCSFTMQATGTWKNGESQASVKPAKLAIAFNAVNIDEGTAEAVGDSGKWQITVRLLGSYLHLMQMDPYGALHVTTVMDTETRAGRLQAAHTRHEYTPVSLPGLTSRPEQYYGDCESGR
jgi:hypothetical protein